MINPTPWSLDENDESIIRDSNGEVIAKDYRFLDLDDFERIPKAMNKLTGEIKKDAFEFTDEITGVTARGYISGGRYVLTDIVLTKPRILGNGDIYNLKLVFNFEKDSK